MAEARERKMVSAFLEGVETFEAPRLHPKERDALEGLLRTWQVMTHDPDVAETACQGLRSSELLDQVWCELSLSLDGVPTPKPSELDARLDKLERLLARVDSAVGALEAKLSEPPVDARRPPDRRAQDRRPPPEGGKAKAAPKDGRGRKRGRRRGDSQADLPFWTPSRT
jgi:hypothetical protein